MKNLMVSLFCFLSFTAIAEIDKAFYAKAPMEILDSRFSFKENQAHNVEIVLFKNTEKKISDLKIFWTYVDPETGDYHEEEKTLKVKKIFSVGDVRVLQAVAVFDKDANPENERFAVTLHHHVVENGRKVWTAKVRHGFGYCESQDSKMSLRGDPVYAAYALPTTTVQQPDGTVTTASPNTGEEF